MASKYHYPPMARTALLRTIRAMRSTADMRDFYYKEAQYCASVGMTHYEEDYSRKAVKYSSQYWAYIHILNIIHDACRDHEPTGQEWAITIAYFRGCAHAGTMSDDYEAYTKFLNEWDFNKYLSILES